jgi:predicted nucleic acid-binding protein
MDRLFLDANILVSAALGSPAMAKLWQAAERDEVRLLTSAYALDEARRNLDFPQQPRLTFLAGQVTIVPECVRPLPFAVDLPDGDRPILASAAYAGATHLITGDRRHFGKLYGSMIEGVLICSLRQYLEGSRQGP